MLVFTSMVSYVVAVLGQDLDRSIDTLKSVTDAKVFLFFSFGQISKQPGVIVRRIIVLTYRPDRVDERTMNQSLILIIN